MAPAQLHHRALIVGRLAIGFGIGASAIAVPAYLAEIAPTKQRGAVVQVYEVRGFAPCACCCMLGVHVLNSVRHLHSA